MAEAETSSGPAPARAGGRAAMGFIFAAALMDIVALGIVVPVLPHLIQNMAGGSTRQALHYVGIFGTVWALMQFVFSPIVGSLSDHFGRRPVLLISIFGLGADYVIMALAPNLAWLFVGRLISGITAASFSTAGAYIADISPPEKRAANFGLMGAAFGIGFVLGPSLGGLLGQINPRLPFWVAAGLALINGLYGLFVLPESLPRERRTRFSWRNANPLGSFKLLRSYPGLLGMASIGFFYNLGHQALQSVFVLYTGYRYGWGPGKMGLFLGAVGVSSIIVQGGLVRPVVRYFGERGAMLIGLSGGVIGFTIFATAQTGAEFLWGQLVFLLFNLVQPGYMGLMSRRVSSHEQGRLQGAASGIQSITGLIGPGLFTTVFAWAISAKGTLHTPGLAVYLAAALLLAALLLALRFARPAVAPAVEASSPA